MKVLKKVEIKIFFFYCKKQIFFLKNFKNIIKMAYLKKKIAFFSEFGNNN